MSCESEGGANKLSQESHPSLMGCQCNKKVLLKAKYEFGEESQESEETRNREDCLCDFSLCM